MTTENLIQIGVPANLTQAVLDCFVKYQINTPLRQCHFLAQVMHESGGLKILEENLNYSADGLLKIFPKYFTKELATSYARNPQKIANRVYASRMGNGDENSGDGYKYRGRGAIQTTGKSNYTKLKTEFNIDVITNPDLVKQSPLCIMSAGSYWNANKINLLADQDDIIKVTKAVNGGLNGLSDRQEWLNRCKGTVI